MSNGSAVEPALQVTGLAVRFGATEVLRELNLAVPTGSITALLGPNGAGKTTLVRCATGLVRPAAGTIRVLGVDIATGRPDPARVGVMPQRTGAWSGIGPVELLTTLAGLYAHPLPVPALTAALGIDAFARTPYRRLSGGQQQLVNLAGALVGRPELVFLDEPTAGLDPHARRATWAVLRQLRESGVSTLLTTHAMDEAAALADLVHILDRGRTAVSGTVAELTADGRSLEDVYLDHTSHLVAS